MMGEIALSVPSIGDGEVIICATLGGAGSPTLSSGYICTTLGSAPGFPGGIETGLEVFLGMPTVFHQCAEMVPQDWDVLMLLLNQKHPERRDQKKT